MSNIRQWTSGISNSGTSLVLTMPRNTTAGSTLVLYGGSKNAVGISSVVATHDSLATVDDNDATSVRSSIWDKLAITGGDTVFTITWAATTPSAAYLFEVANLTAVDLGNAQAGTTSPSTLTITTTQAAEIVFASSVWQASSTVWTAQTAPFSAFSDLVTSSGTADIRLVVSVMPVSVTGTYGNTWTVSPATTRCWSEVVGYKLSAILPDQYRVNPMISLLPQ